MKFIAVSGWLSVVIYTLYLLLDSVKPISLVMSCFIDSRLGGASTLPDLKNRNLVKICLTNSHGMEFHSGLW